jgi:hypothetical protein
MEQEKKIDVVYIGLHPETPRYLNQETRFNLVAVALLDCFGAWTINPANWLLKITYKLRTKEQFRLIELFFWHLSYGSCFFSSGIFRRYAGYIRLLSKQGIAILDTENEELLLEYIKVKNIDLIIVNSWGILSEEVVSAPRFGMINIHPSKLPKYRGALPTLWALKNQDSSLSVTFMLLNRGIDTGKILHQHEFEILKSDSAIDLERKIDRILKKHLNIDVLDYLDGKIVPYEQDESLASMTGKYEAYRLVD